MKKTFRIIASLLLAVIMAVSAASAAAFAAKASLNKTSVTLVKGYTATLKVSGTSKDVKWSSKNSKIADVSKSGKVTAKKAGTTYITAKVGGSTLRCRVKVVNGSISLNKSSVTLEKGGSAAVKLTVKGDRSLAASIGDRSVASVKLGKWSNDTAQLKITGRTAGKTVIKIYSKKYPSVYKNISVTVKSGKDDDSEIDGAGDGDGEISQMSYAEQVLYYCNVEREKAGVSPLTLDSKLCSAAEVRASELSQSFAHTRPNGTSCFTAMQEAGCTYGYAGENIAWGQRSAEEVVDDWMDSPGHRANILSSNYKRLGVGKNGTYWVQMFSD